MRLASGTRLGRYEIVALLGAGGMGEVYRATDARLKRSVAIKVLSSEAAADADLCARLKREAQAVAALKHPYVCVLYDVADLDGAECLVMEYLEGETLAVRLRRGPVPFDEALRYALQIASALEAAHRDGITHRDLKPGNVMLTAAGAKLLDFGIAKRSVPAVGGAPQAATAIPATAHATILGTLGYCAPEQLQGRDADARSDIFALGATLFELVTGRRAFGGETNADTVAAVMSAEPDAAALDAAPVPELFKKVVLKCLAKEPAQRWQTAGDLADVLRWVETEKARTIQPGVARRSSKLTWAAGALAVAAAAAAGYAASALRAPGADDAPLHLSVVAPPGTAYTERDITGHPQFALSPDGTRLAFVAAARGARPQLWVRALASGAAQPLAGTEDASGPFWSPDSRHLAFFARGKLKRVALDGGAPRDLADSAVDVASGAWSSTGTILFSPASGVGLRRVDAEGGPVADATELDLERRETSHRWPQFLPDGNRFLYFMRGGADDVTGVYLGELRTARKVALLRATANAVYDDGSGYLLFERDGTLTAQRLDIESGKLVGEAQSLNDRILGLRGPSYLPISVARDGLLAYWHGEPSRTQLQWFDRTGRPLGAIEMPERSDAPSLSSDGMGLLVTQRRDSNQSQLWRVDLPSGRASQLTFGAGTARFGIWSPDGENALYTTLGPVGSIQLTQRAANGAGAEAFIAGPEEHYALFPDDWSRDGRWILYAATTSSAWDLFALDMSNATARAVLASPANETQAHLSPDGRWLAYASDESNAWEIYVQPFPEGGGKWRLSAAGGTQPLWRSDGRELFYLAADGRLMAVSIGEGATFEPGATVALFETRVPPMLAPFRRAYSVAPDGERFLLNNLAADAEPQAITIVRNWQPRR